MSTTKPEALLRGFLGRLLGALTRRSGDQAIVPIETVEGRALVVVVAIMTLLAGLTVGAVHLVRSAASDWQNALRREVTIQVRPVDGRDFEAEIAKAVAAARGIAGIAEVRAYTAEETRKALEPWLGTGLALDDLPIPRLITVTIAPGATPDLALLKRRLADTVSGASLDDHRSWSERLGAMRGGFGAAGFLVLALVVAAAILSIGFATQSAVAVNRPMIEVLHLIGAKDGFIAAEFQRHFLWLGALGGFIGALIAMLAFAVFGLWARRGVISPETDQVEALFGRFAMGWQGYAGIVGVMVLVTAITALTSRLVVLKTLRSLD